METLPLISIITPTYNHEHFIADCIKSVQNQSYANWEMIIVNDGSTDQTLINAQQAALGDARIKIFDRENVGIFRLAETYNFALAQAKGEWIAILEGDDLWLPEKLALQTRAIQIGPHNSVLAWGGAQTFFGSEDNILNTYPLEDCMLMHSKYFNTPTGSILGRLYFGNFIPALTILIRVSVLKSIGGFKQNFNLPLVDLPTILELAEKGPFVFNPEVLGKWRFYPSQITKTYTFEIIEGFEKLIKWHKHKIKQNTNLEVVDNVSDYDIDKHFKKLFIVSLSRSGRYKLIRKEFKSARKDYLKSIFFPGYDCMLWRVRSIVGLFFSFLHLDVEWLAKILKKPSYK